MYIYTHNKLTVVGVPSETALQYAMPAPLCLPLACPCIAGCTVLPAMPCILQAVLPESDITILKFKQFPFPLLSPFHASPWSLTSMPCPYPTSASPRIPTLGASNAMANVPIAMIDSGSRKLFQICIDRNACICAEKHQLQSRPPQAAPELN